MSAITLTFGDQSENGVGMQMIGTAAAEGFSRQDLLRAKERFEQEGYSCELVDLNPFSTVAAGIYDSASVLIVRQGVQALLNPMQRTANDLLMEQSQLITDKKVRMRGRVVNKLARHNLCFADESQECDYAAGKGTIVAFRDVPATAGIKNNLASYFGPKADHLTAEGNYYYDLRKCGIGFHGDGERKLVIAVRVGDSFPLHFQWFFQTSPVGRRVELELNHGDLYAMGEKAVGFDWKKKNIYTLRHAAGAAKFLQISS